MLLAAGSLAETRAGRDDMFVTWIVIASVFTRPLCRPEASPAAGLAVQIDSNAPLLPSRVNERRQCFGIT